MFIHLLIYGYDTALTNKYSILSSVMSATSVGRN